jgi:hypothetical protein
LKRVLEQAAHKIYLIVDGHPDQRSKAVRICRRSCSTSAPDSTAGILP